MEVAGLPIEKLDVTCFAAIIRAVQINLDIALNKEQPRFAQSSALGFKTARK
jgi:hypothetical protein